MKREYLGDSYDAVKRLWCDLLAEWAPLYAEPRFIPNEIRKEFTAFTRIPILGAHRPAVYSLLNDPDTGIRLPGRPNKSDSVSHVNLATIRSQLAEAAVLCVITFDQSHYREKDFGAKDQRLAKMDWLNRNGVYSFYYVSHAPFLFAFAKRVHRDAVFILLANAGMPSWRIELMN